MVERSTCVVSPNLMSGKSLALDSPIGDGHQILHTVVAAKSSYHSGYFAHIHGGDIFVPLAWKQSERLVRMATRTREGMATLPSVCEIDISK